MPRDKKRVTVDLHANESIINQIAYTSFQAGHDMEDVREFIRKADRCVTVDDLLRVVLADYEVIIKE